MWILTNQKECVEKCVLESVLLAFLKKKTVAAAKGKPHSQQTETVSLPIVSFLFLLRIVLWTYESSLNHWFPENACEAFQLIFRKLHAKCSVESSGMVSISFRNRCVKISGSRFLFFNFKFIHFFVLKNCFNEWVQKMFDFEA